MLPSSGRQGPRPGGHIKDRKAQNIPFGHTRNKGPGRGWRPPGSSRIQGRYPLIHRQRHQLNTLPSTATDPRFRLHGRSRRSLTHTACNRSKQVSPEGNPDRKTQNPPSGPQPGHLFENEVTRPNNLCPEQSRSKTTPPHAERPALTSIFRDGSSVQLAGRFGLLGGSRAG